MNPHTLCSFVVSPSQPPTRASCCLHELTHCESEIATSYLIVPESVVEC